MLTACGRLLLTGAAVSKYVMQRRRQLVTTASRRAIPRLGGARARRASTGTTFLVPPGDHTRRALVERARDHSRPEGRRCPGLPGDWAMVVSLRLARCDLQQGGGPRPATDLADPARCPRYGRVLPTGRTRDIRTRRVKMVVTLGSAQCGEPWSASPRVRRGNLGGTM